MRQFLFAVVLSAISVCLSSPAFAQFGKEKPKTESENGVRFDQPKTQRWRMGLIITASKGACVDLFGTAPIPSSWPEQTVKLIKEEFSPEVKRVSYRELDTGVRQMLVEVPQLQAGGKATALLTFEITRMSSLAPTDTKIYSIPDRLPRELGKYLAISPMIECKSPQVTKLAKEIIADKSGAWEQVEAFYDWVRDNIEYKNGKLKSTLTTLKDRTGDCEEMTSLFIAFCRATKIPARTVWIPDHCYPEFYLTDDKGVGHWFPCQVAGTRDFGGIQEIRPVLQKGDAFKVPERKDTVRYVPELLTGKPAYGGGAPPSYQFVRELLPAD